MFPLNLLNDFSREKILLAPEKKRREPKEWTRADNI